MNVFQSILYNYPNATNHEVELRFGYLNNNDYTHSLPKYLFERCLRIVRDKQHQMNCQRYSIEYSTVYYYDYESPETSLRKIVYTDENNQQLSTVYQKKKKLDQTDLLLVPVMVRLTRSKESCLQSIKPPDKIIHMRKRKRNIFHFELYEIHLTEVIDTTKRYEIEVELMPEFIRKQYNIDIIYNTIVNWLSVERFHIITYRQYMTTLIAYNRLIESSLNQSIKQLQKEHEIAIIMNKDVVYDTELKINRLTSILANIKSIEQPILLQSKPKNVQYSDLSLIQHNYIVTNKLDGTNCFIYVCVQDRIFYIYLIYETTIDVFYTSEDVKLHQYHSSVFQGELCLDGTLHLFDALLYSDTSLFLKTHPQRIQVAQQFVNDIKRIQYSIKLEVKLFFECSTLSESIQSCIMYMYSRYKQPWLSNDGLIFIPNSTSYKPLLESDPMMFKYKLPSKISIDFLLKIQDNQYKLYVYNDFNQMYEFNHLSLNSKYMDTTLLEDSTIIECCWEESQFIPYKIRHDKTRPNSLHTCLATFEDMKNPIRLQSILHPTLSVSPMMSMKDSMTEIRKYHNVVKTEMIKRHCCRKTVLDVGFGVGGDMMKYHHSSVRVQSLYAIEPNTDHIKTLFSRFPFVLNNITHFEDQTISPLIQQYTGLDVKLSKMELARIWNKTQIIHSHGQDYQTIFSIVSQNYFDVVTSFFSLSYFFQDDDILTQFIKTVHNSLKMKGLFIGACLDGGQVLKLLNDQASYKTDSFSLSRINNIIHFHIEDSVTSKHVQEYLVFFDVFQQRLEKSGFRLVMTTLFDPPKQLKIRSQERVLSSLYRTFVFEKISLK
jgi:hypothetical protein